MPPKPIEDIDFPALGDQILDFLLAAWAFVCDLCLAVWDTACQALWAAWTYPPFEAFRSELAAAVIALTDYVVAHPVTSTAIAVLALIVVPRVLSALRILFLHCLGFGRRGVRRGSYAANYQSTNHGGNVHRGSTFSRFQSQGARGGYRAVDGTVYYWD